jgi:hypothetical protein
MPRHGGPWIRVGFSLAVTVVAPLVLSPEDLSGHAQIDVATNTLAARLTEVPAMMTGDGRGVSGYGHKPETDRRDHRLLAVRSCDKRPASTLLDAGRH